MKATPGQLARASIFIALLGGCSSTTVLIEPTSGSPYPMAVDCGPLSDKADCADGALAIDARVVIPPNSRAVFGGSDMTPTFTIYGPEGKLFSGILVRNPAGQWSAANLSTYR